MQSQIPPTLIDLYHVRNLARFRETIRPPQTATSAKRSNNASAAFSGGSSLSKSPRFDNYYISSNPASFAPSSVVNRRDVFGRTALMLAVCSTLPEDLQYVMALLDCPITNVNWQDHESGWTALHRALYHGNIAAVRLLMKRSDCDPKIKDFEGFTAIDLFNSTIDGTNPDVDDLGNLELYTWGNNRNFVLGVGGDGDRPFPERVNIKPKEGSKRKDASESIEVSSIAMSKLRTGIVTTEASNNVRFCGYGGNARLGASGKTAFSFEGLSDFPHKVSQLAIGLDHTVILTATGDVYTFGLNHHGQLGYVIDSPQQKGEEPTQLTPRKVAALKKEEVKGVAASRYHTAVHTAAALYTWGANRGQLGYGSTGNQSAPRQVAAVQTPIVQLVATDYATVCLLETTEVVVLFRGVTFKLTFPMSRFPTSMQVYRPPSTKTSIRKIAGGGSDLVAVSTIGDVFHWTLDDSVVDVAQASRSATRLWDLRRKFTAVTDADVSNDSIILCTRSGHVFIRQRRIDQSSKTGDLKLSAGASSSRRNFKFQRLAHLQRAVKVSVNGHGGFAAIRTEVKIKPISVDGPTIAEDWLKMLPHWQRARQLNLPLLPTLPRSISGYDLDDEAIAQDLDTALRLLQLANGWDEACELHAVGTDMHLVVENRKIPLHSIVLLAHCQTFKRILTGGEDVAGFHYDTKRRQLHIKQSNFLSCLLLTHHFYGNNIPCIWDPRIAYRLQTLPSRPAVGIIRDELQRLAHRLQLTELGRACGSVEKLEPRMEYFVSSVADLYQPEIAVPAAYKTDVVLRLQNAEELACHSFVLRARCPFFAALLDDPEWTVERRDKKSESGELSLQVDVQHIPRALMHPLLSFLYSGQSSDALNTKVSESADVRIDFISSVLALANEFLLDELKLLCSELLRPFIDLRTVSAILADALMFEAGTLAEACCHYMACNMETLLEGDYLADLDASLIDRLASSCRAKQIAKLPISRSDSLVKTLMAKHADWLAEQDIAKPPTAQTRRIRTISKSPRLSPSSLPSSPPFLGLKSPPAALPRSKQSRSPEVSPSLQAVLDEQIFAIDDLDLNAPSDIGQSPLSRSTWSTKPPTQSTPSLRDIMADQTTFKASARQPSSFLQSNPAASRRPSTPVTPLTALSNAIKTRETVTPSATWRKFDTPTKMSINSIQSEQARSPTPARQAGFSPQTGSRMVGSLDAHAGGSAAGQSPSPQRITADPTSAVGVPVISPMRTAYASTGSASAMRNRLPGQDGVWVNYTSTNSFFSPDLATSPSDGQAASFAKIQSAQRDEGESIRNARKAPKSLADIQQEEAFEAWFAQEQRKFQEQTAQAEAIAAAESSRGSGRRHAPRGRGRGRGKQTPAKAAGNLQKSG